MAFVRVTERARIQPSHKGEFWPRWGGNVAVIYNSPRAFSCSYICRLSCVLNICSTGLVRICLLRICSYNVDRRFPAAGLIENEQWKYGITGWIQLTIPGRDIFYENFHSQCKSGLHIVGESYVKNLVRLWVGYKVLDPNTTPKRNQATDWR